MKLLSTLWKNLRLSVVVVFEVLGWTMLKSDLIWDYVPMWKENRKHCKSIMVKKQMYVSYIITVFRSSIPACVVHSKNG